MDRDPWHPAAPDRPDRAVPLGVTLPVLQIPVLQIPVLQIPVLQLLVRRQQVLAGQKLRLLGPGVLARVDSRALQARLRCGPVHRAA